MRPRLELAELSLEFRLLLRERLKPLLRLPRPLLRFPRRFLRPAELPRHLLEPLLYLWWSRFWA